MVAPMIRFDTGSVMALQRLDRDIQQLVFDFSKRGGLNEPLNRSVTQVAIPSLIKNFEVGGRPRWRSVGSSSYREAHGQRSRGGGSIFPVLVVTRKLFNAAKAQARWTVKDNKAVYGNWPERAWYGPLHDLGPSDKAFPARPFAVLQDPSDLDDIQEVFADWVEERVNARIKLVYR